VIEEIIEEEERVKAKRGRERRSEGGRVMIGVRKLGVGY